MIDINKAKQKILDLAIRGKLTKQHHKDGNINDEIKYYINNVEIENEFKKNKKQVKINVIEELPFDVPKTWRWVRLGNVCSIFGRIGYRGYTKDDIVDDGNGAISLSPSNLVGFGKMDYSNCTYISWDKYNESPEIMVNNEDVIIVKTGSSYGKTGFITYLQKKATINPQLAILKYLQGNKKYILIVLNTIFVKKQLDDFVLGSAVPTFSQEDLANLMIPLPPLAEQNRIVEIVEQLFGILDKIDELQKKYQKDKEILKSKIIEAGIRGKLTKQLKFDGNAFDLLDDIRKEKEKLIKEGKIKRDKKETYIYKNPKDNLYYEKYQDGTEKCIQDELPFEIPVNWVWCRASQLLYLIAGTSYNKADIKSDGIRILRGGNIVANQLVLFEDDVFVSDSYQDEVKNVYKGDIILVASTGSKITIGKPARILVNHHKTQIGAFLRIARIYKKCISNYLWYIFNSGYYKNHILESVKGTNINNIKNEYIEDMLIPLSSLGEQERIVKIMEVVLNKLGNDSNKGDYER